MFRRYTGPRTSHTESKTKGKRRETKGSNGYIDIRIRAGLWTR
jgi:hypothetical protein